MFMMAIIGILIAAYVTQSFVRKVGIVCVNTGCEAVRKNPASYITGIPAPAFGLVGYTILVLILFFRSTSVTLQKKLLPWVIGIAAGGVAFISWFTYIEITVIKAICTWCAISGINMSLLFLLSIKSFILEKKSKILNPVP